MSAILLLIKRVHHAARGIAAWLLTIALAMPMSVHAAPEWVESIDTMYEKPERSAVQIQLAQPFSIAATESGSGTQCSFRLQPGFALAPHQGRFGKDTIPWQPDASLPIVKVLSEWIAEQMWITLVLRREMQCTAQLSADHRTLWVTLSQGSVPSSQALQSALESARQALAKGQPQNAINALQAIINTDGANSPEALEYLGVAYERAQRYPQAIKTYRSYLEKFADSPGSARVQQRLQGLVLMQKETPAPLREAKPNQADQSMRWFGVLSNAYQYFGSATGNESMKTYQSTWITDANINGRYRGEQYDTKVFFSGSLWHDFDNNIDKPTRLSRAYIDVFDKNGGQQLKAGRQNTQGEGVLGRFDGVRYSKSLGNEWRVNALAGYPVATSRQVNIDSEHQLFGTSLDYEPGSSAWKSNLFFTQQTYNGMTDRQATGAEVTYMTTTQSWLGYIDYDVFFNELNTFMINANWFGKNDAYYYLSADYRRSPVLTLDNALIGQGVQDLNALVESGGFTEKTLEEVALDRTAVSTTLSGGLNRRWSEHFRWAVDVSGWQLSDTNTSAGVEGFAGTDVETNISLQLISNDLWRPRDMGWYTLRYASLTNSVLYSLTAEVRFPLAIGDNDHWRLRPRLRVYERDFTIGSGKQTSIQPLVKLEYTGNSEWAWETDIGTEFLSTEQAGISMDRKDYFIYTRLDWMF